MKGDPIMFTRVLRLGLALGASITLAACSGIGNAMGPPPGTESSLPQPGSAAMGVSGVPQPGATLCSATSACGHIIVVGPGGDFQHALNIANPGDTITLAAGSSYNSSPVFTLPLKTGAGYITIESSALSRLPGAGSRVHPSDVPNMPTLVGVTTGLPILCSVRCGGTSTAAHNYRFIGVEFKMAPGKWAYQMLEFGSGLETTVAALPHDIIIDRCYIHGDPVAGTKRGINANAVNLTVENSYISEIHLVGQDAQAIGSWNTPGPMAFTNNHLEASGENVMFGGANVNIPGVIPSDILIQHNYFFKPLTWRVGDPSYAGIHWTVKNSLEFKMAQRVIVSGNVFANCWVDAQVGFAILYTPRTQSGAMPWAVVQHITFTNNIVNHAAGGMNISGKDDAPYGFPGESNHLLVKNNLFEDINQNNWGGNGRLFQVLNSTDTLTIDHNVGFETYTVLLFDGILPITNFVYTNNITPHGEFGVAGSGSGEGLPTLNRYTPGYVFLSNLIFPGNPAIYPPGNYFPANEAAVGFTNPGAGDYSLRSDSPYKGKGTGGSDPGVDMNAITAATAGVAD